VNDTVARSRLAACEGISERDGPSTLEVRFDRRQFIGSLGAILAGCGADTTLQSVSVADRNLAFDGNSLTYGFTEAPGGRVSAPYPNQVVADAKNYGLVGVDWTRMLESGVDAALSDRPNVLVCWETTNTATELYMANGLNAPFVTANAQGASTYMRARRAAGWDRIVLLSSIPRESFSFKEISEEDREAMNRTLIACDHDMQSNYQAYGADTYVNLRDGPMNFLANGWTFVGEQSGFNQLAKLYGDGGFWLPAMYEPPGRRIHLSDGGYQFIAQRVAETLSRS
jgi:hypothetical protein